MVIASTLVMQGVGANIPKVMSTVVIQSYSEEKHYLKSVHIGSFYGPYFPNFTGPYLFRKFLYSVWMPENMDHTVSILKYLINSVFFWIPNQFRINSINTVFSRFWIEYWDLLRKSPYLVRMRENTETKNSKYGYFLSPRNGLRNSFTRLFLFRFW